MNAALANVSSEDANAIQLSDEMVNLKNCLSTADADATTNPNPLLDSYTPANGTLLKIADQRKARPAKSPTSDKYALK